MAGRSCGGELPLSPLAPALAMHTPPLAYYPLLAAVLGGYCAVLLAARSAYIRSRQRWL